MLWKQIISKNQVAESTEQKKVQPLMTIPFIWLNLHLTETSSREQRN